MTANEALERRIDELCSENERLRQQVASIIGRSFRTADKMDCLATENAKLRGARDVWQENDAKLRELCRRLMNHIEHPPCDGCSFECDGTDLTRCDEWSLMVYDARELGIEVDE